MKKRSPFSLDAKGEQEYLELKALALERGYDKEIEELEGYYNHMNSKPLGWCATPNAQSHSMFLKLSKELRCKLGED